MLEGEGLAVNGGGGCGQEILNNTVTLLRAQIRPKHISLQAQIRTFSMAPSTWIFTHTTQAQIPVHSPVHFAVHGFADGSVTACHAPYSTV